MNLDQLAAGNLGSPNDRDVRAAGGVGIGDDRAAFGQDRDRRDRPALARLNTATSRESSPPRWSRMADFSSGQKRAGPIHSSLRGPRSSGRIGNSRWLPVKMAIECSPWVAARRRMTSWAWAYFGSRRRRSRGCGRGRSVRTGRSGCRSGLWGGRGGCQGLRAWERRFMELRGCGVGAMVRRSWRGEMDDGCLVRWRAMHHSPYRWAVWLLGKRDAERSGASWGFAPIPRPLSPKPGGKGAGGGLGC